MEPNDSEIHERHYAFCKFNFLMIYAICHYTRTHPKQSANHFHPKNLPRNMTYLEAIGDLVGKPARSRRLNLGFCGEIHGMDFRNGNGCIMTSTGWWFHICFIFTPIWANDPN